MKLIGAGFGGEIHLCAGLTSVLASVSVLYYRSLIDFVRPQRQVACAGVVQIQVRVHVVVAVGGKEIRRAWKSVRAEIPVAAAGADDDNWNGERDAGDVAPGAG